jgi:hypothetical protein
LDSKKRIGILEILAAPGDRGIMRSVGHFLWTKQYASVMPQSIAAWCRQAGHEVYYNTWYGIGSPENALPDDLDFVFLSSITQSSPVAYALGMYYKQRGTTTVFGGPHAKAFPIDAARFFDLVVINCDRGVVTEILAGEHRPGSLVSTDRPLTDLPPLAERYEDVKRASAMFGRFNYASTMIPMVASVGCPYTCNFCSDWNTPYSMTPTDQLEADLIFASEKMPGVKMMFADPNFGVRFDDTMSTIERVGVDRMNPYIMESSLAILKPDRLKRLRDSNCMFVAPGIESWNTYGNKAGTGSNLGREKLDRISQRLAEIHEYIPGIQYNLIFGLDSDAGSEPVALTKELMERCAFGYPALNIPVPFGGTPMFDGYLADGRILNAMPFAFYYLPYLVTTLQNYDPVDYYDHVIDMFDYSASRKIFWTRIKESRSMRTKVINSGRTIAMRGSIGKLRAVRNAIADNDEMHRFHLGGQAKLPEFYRQTMSTMLGKWQELLPESHWTPVLDQVPASDVVTTELQLV